MNCPDKDFQNILFRICLSHSCCLSRNLNLGFDQTFAKIGKYACNINLRSYRTSLGSIKVPSEFPRNVKAKVIEGSMENKFGTSLCYAGCHWLKNVRCLGKQNLFHRDCHDGYPLPYILAYPLHLVYYPISFPTSNMQHHLLLVIN